MRFISAIVLTLGIVVFLIGMALPHKTETRFYEDWRGQTITYEGDAPNGMNMGGVLLMISGGVGMWLFRDDGKDDKKQIVGELYGCCTGNCCRFLFRLRRCAYHGAYGDRREQGRGKESAERCDNLHFVHSNRHFCT